MKKEFAGRTYTIGKIEHDHDCSCSAVCKPDRDGSIELYIDPFTNECWECNIITIDDVQLYYNAFDELGVEGGSIESLALPKEDENGCEYRHWTEAVRDLLGDDLYGEMTSDATPNIDAHHRQIKLNKFHNYMVLNGLTPYMDSERGFNNEWTIYLAPAGAVINTENLQQMTIEEAVSAVEASFDYEYNCTDIRIY